MASCTTHADELVGVRGIRLGTRLRSWSRRSQKAHEIGEVCYIVKHRLVYQVAKVEDAIGRNGGGTIWTFVALVIEDEVGNSHFHGVGFGGVEKQRFVLRLPPEASNGAVVSIAVQLARNAEGRIGRLSYILNQRRIRNSFYK